MPPNQPGWPQLDAALRTHAARLGNIDPAIADDDLAVVGDACRVMQAAADALTESRHLRALVAAAREVLAKCDDYFEIDDDGVPLWDGAFHESGLRSLNALRAALAATDQAADGGGREHNRLVSVETEVRAMRELLRHRPMWPTTELANQWHRVCAALDDGLGASLPAPLTAPPRVEGDDK